MTLAETNEQLKEAAKSAKQRAQAIIDEGKITIALSNAIWKAAGNCRWSVWLEEFIDTYAGDNPRHMDVFVKLELTTLLKELLNKNGFQFDTTNRAIVWNHLLS
jgi:hypothetical protein